MTPPGGAAARSGDPRRRAAQAPPEGTRSQQRTVVVALVGAAALVVLAVVALRPSDVEPDDGARDHAEVACDLTSKAEEAARGETGARYAAAVLLLDNAVIESARAAELDAGFAVLDQAVRAVHAAGHTGRPRLWQAALDDALSTCRTSPG